MYEHQLRPGSLAKDYSELVIDKVKLGFSCHLMTFLFPKLPTPQPAILPTMKEQVERVYATFATRVTHRPRSAPADTLPILVGAFDLPVYKKNKASAPDAKLNGGLHFHGLMLVPRHSRLKQSVIDHFRQYEALYTRSGQLIQTIDVRPVVDGHRRLVDYLFKTIKAGKISLDEGLLILPRTRSEMTKAPVRWLAA